MPMTLRNAQTGHFAGLPRLGRGPMPQVSEQIKLAQEAALRRFGLLQSPDPVKALAREFRTKDHGYGGPVKSGKPGSKGVEWSKAVSANPHGPGSFTG
jgi:hypothetical protein